MMMSAYLLRFVLTAAVSAAAIPARADSATAAGASAAAQCRGTDAIIQKRIRFARGRTTAVVKDTVRLCTGHEYRLRARAGQTMSLHLAAGRRTSMTLRAPDGEALLDGGNDWEGALPSTGEYTIHVGTDATARYTLEVTIR
jgi:hypothetical protein